MTAEINTSAENFKTSPLGFLMSVLAKYQAHNQRIYDTSRDKIALKKSRETEDVLDNLKIALSKTDELKKEPANEAIMIHAVENFEKDEKEIILESVFEYLNLIEGALHSLDPNSQDGKNLLNEYYDVSRLGLLLNCYLGDFDNDDFFYGTFADIVQTVKNAVKINSDSCLSDPDGANSEENQSICRTEKNVIIENLCNIIEEKIQKADINLSFRDFIAEIYAAVEESERKIIYEDLIRTYAESLLNKVLIQEVHEDEIGRLACAKQIQRIFEKVMLE